MENFTVEEDMADVHQQNDEEEKSKKLVKLPTTLASIESLTFPLVIT